MSAISVLLSTQIDLLNNIKSKQKEIEHLQQLEKEFLRKIEKDTERLADIRQAITVLGGNPDDPTPFLQSDGMLPAVDGRLVS